MSSRKLNAPYCGNGPVMPALDADRIERRNGMNTTSDATNEITWPDGLVLMYCENFKSLVGQTRRLVGSHDVAQEIVQDAFVRFQVRGSTTMPGRELAYIRSIALNAARSHLRRRACEDRHRKASSEPDSVEDLCLRQIDHAVLRDRVSQLPEQQRLVVELRYWGGLSEHEIAEQLDISSGSVKTHASRARARLRDQLMKP